MSNVVRLDEYRLDAEVQAAFDAHLVALERARTSGSVIDMATAVSTFQNYINSHDWAVETKQRFFDRVGHSWLGPKSSQLGVSSDEVSELRREIMALRADLERARS